jgi:DNA primase
MPDEMDVPVLCASAAGRSFAAYLDTGRYYCFSCHRSGNALDLWAAARHLSL